MMVFFASVTARGSATHACADIAPTSKTAKYAYFKRLSFCRNWPATATAAKRLKALSDMSILQPSKVAFLPRNDGCYKDAAKSIDKRLKASRAPGNPTIGRVDYAASRLVEK